MKQNIEIVLSKNNSIFLTENEFKRFIKENINEVINNGISWKTLSNAANKAENIPTDNDSEYDRRERQADNLNMYSMDYYKQYGLSKDDVLNTEAYLDAQNSPLGFDKAWNKYLNNSRGFLDGMAEIPSKTTIRKYLYMKNDIDSFYNGEQEYRNGKWRKIPMF